MAPTPSPHEGTRPLARTVAIVLGLVAVTAVVFGVTAGSPQAGAPALGFSEPARIEIPRIGVSSPLGRIGLDGAGAMEAPDPVDRPGWFTPSPPPGVPGATVIAGHVAWKGEPSVFYRLADLQPGDRVRVSREDGTVVVFEVTRIGSFPKDAFPTRSVYGQPDGAELRLITCGGGYDETGRYLENVIVWARAVSTRLHP